MKPEYQNAWSAMLEGLAEDAAAGRLEPDAERRKRRERTERARIDLPDPPPARSPQERLEAARGVHVHGDGLGVTAGERRRIRKHREADDV